MIQQHLPAISDSIVLLKNDSVFQFPLSISDNTYRQKWADKEREEYESEEYFKEKNLGKRIIGIVVAMESPHLHPSLLFSWLRERTIGFPFQPIPFPWLSGLPGPSAQKLQNFQQGIFWQTIFHGESLLSGKRIPLLEHLLESPLKPKPKGRKNGITQ